MTCSIVARDAETGPLGVGVQNHQLAVGAVVPWIAMGTGAVATQGTANAALGPQALALMQHGLEAEPTLRALASIYPVPFGCQIAIVDAAGGVAVHTDAGCIPYAGHRTGAGYSVQANMMLNDGVPEAMATAFEQARGPLAVRILRALEAAEEHGGCLRGALSAAIEVRRAGATAPDWEWDLRVDDDPQPLARLRDLVNARLAARLLRESLQLPTADDAAPVTLTEALLAYEQADDLARSAEQDFWFAVGTLAGTLGEVEQAAAILEPLFARAPRWRILLNRLRPPLRNEPLIERFPLD